MADTTALYLTKHEMTKLFPALPVAVQRTWKKKVKDEMNDAFETKEELLNRMQKPWNDESKELESFVKHVGNILEQGKGVDAIDLQKFPDSAFPRFFYTIGACGMSAFIQISLQQKNIKNGDMKAIAGLSFIRHAILEANTLQPV